MDTTILDPLKSAHDKIDEILETIELAQSPDEKHRLLKALSRELDHHFKIEESSLFNFLESLPRFEEAVNEYFDEHMEINDQLDELLHLQESADSEFNNRLEKLIDLILDHLDSEETSLYPKVETELSEEELVLLNGKIQAALHPGPSFLPKAA